MFKYDSDNNIINKIRERLKISTYDLVKSYVDLLYSLEITMDHRTNLNAGKINRKISRMLLGLHINEEDNLDIVTYTDTSDRYLTDNFNDIYEKFIRLNIYETTGVTYSEFMRMSPVELDLFFKYTVLKTTILDIEPPELTDSVNNNALFS